MSDDLSLYAGLWVALVRGQVAGVGYTALEAKGRAQHSRPKEWPTMIYVEPPGGTELPLSPLLERLRPVLAQCDTPIYLVGGAVRDALLGRVSHDLDFVVPQRAIHWAFKVGNALKLPAYVLDEARDTGRVVLEDTTLDFACFRGADLEADLRDRDFTMNAIALPVAARTTASLIDPCGGVADLQARRLRLTNPNALTQDPLRALRAIRQAKSFGFELDAETKTAVTHAASLLHTISQERIRDELLKMLQTAVPHLALAEMGELGLLTAVLPDIAALDGVAQSAPHHEAVLSHTLSVVRWLVSLETAVWGHQPPAPPLDIVRTAFASVADPLRQHLERLEDGDVNGRTLLRLSGLFHDVGKKATQTAEEQADGSLRYRFLGHEVVGRKIAEGCLHDLCLSNKVVAHVGQVVGGHMRPLHLVNAHGQHPTRRTVYRFFRDLGSAGLDVAFHSLADHLATYDGPGEEALWRDLVGLTAVLCEHYFFAHEQIIAPPRLLNGGDLMALLQLDPGPEVGRLMRLIEEAQAAGEVTTREEAILFAQQARQ